MVKKKKKEEFSFPKMSKKKKKKEEFSFPKLDKNFKPTDTLKVPSIWPSKFLKLKGKVPDKAIRDMCSLGVIEVEFKRRIYPIRSPKAYQKTKTRRMLCSACWPILDKNKKVFGFKRPIGRINRSPSWYKKRGLVIVFDIILKKYRMISLDKYKVTSFWSLKGKKQLETFIDNYTKMFDKKSIKTLYKYFNV